MRRWHTIGLVAIVAVLPLLMAQSTGFPSRPRFQAIGVGAAPGAAGTITGGATLNLVATAVQVNGVALFGAGSIGFTQTAAKTADTDRANTVTPTCDPELTVTAAANGFYAVESHFQWSQQGSTTNGIRVTLDGGTGTARGMMYLQSTNTVAPNATPTANDADNTANQFTYTHGSAGQVRELDIRGAMQVSAAPSVICVEWAQNVTNATATRVRIGGWLKVTRLT